MEKRVETKQASRLALQISLFGPLAVSRGGQAVPLPASRKVRALLAYLALARHPVQRSHLCDLLWDVANDPRGELRWCLSKLRGVVDEPARRRVVVQGEAVSLHLADCAVDALSLQEAAAHVFDTLDAAELAALAGLYHGDLLEDLEVERSPTFESWLVAERRHFRDLQGALLERLSAKAAPQEVRRFLDLWLRHAPLDARPHERLLANLAAHGRIREAEEHLATTARLFASEGVDGRPLQDFWKRTRAEPERQAGMQQVPALTVSASQAVERRDDVPAPGRRRSVAVMPFADMSASAIPGGLADALVHDVITRLAKLRSLRVIAQGTVFSLRDQRIGPEESGRLLGVDYVVSGALQWRGNRIVVRVELAETQSARIVWAEVLDHVAGDTFLLLDEIGSQIVASIDREIETVEVNRAVLKPPGSLDAWEAHHRGLWHMYRFTKADNDQARHFFEIATAADATFARAFAGLSFTHWQDAFQGWSDRKASSELAYASAGESLMADDRDPAAHLAMGRALWLRDQNAQSISELNTAVELSPNYAFGHYSLAFVHAQSGDAEAAIVAADHSRDLSPFDPLLFAMLASRALALVRLGRFEEAAEWSVKAALRPNAHIHIKVVATLSLALAGRIVEARAQLAAVHAEMPEYGLSDFLGAFHLTPDVQATFRKAARQVGLG